MGKDNWMPSVMTFGGQRSTNQCNPLVLNPSPFFLLSLATRLLSSVAFRDTILKAPLALSEYYWIPIKEPTEREKAHWCLLKKPSLEHLNTLIFTLGNLQTSWHLTLQEDLPPVLVLTCLQWTRNFARVERGANIKPPNYLNSTKFFSISKAEGGKWPTWNLNQLLTKVFFNSTHEKLSPSLLFQKLKLPLVLRAQPGRLIWECCRNIQRE